MNHDPVIKVIDLFYTYPNNTLALDGINFMADKGEKIALIGPNGSGKSTLLYLLDGLLLPIRGEIWIKDKKLNKNNLDRIRPIVGLIFQNQDDQLFSHTVWEDVAFGPRNLGLDDREVEKRVKESLEILGIFNLKDESPYNLSSGQKRLASIAGVLAMNPEIILLDEPTSNLDPSSSSSLIRLLLYLNKEREITLIIATHDIDNVPLFSDKVYVMKKGKFIAEGSPAEIFSKPDVIRDASLRLPRVTHLMEILNKKDGVPIKNPYPLTIGEARREILNHIKYR
ncbi:MAG: ATP-binding cassette domain-containing protein [Candidatus Methanoliparum thermophilum]|uniref:ATP-binding cassette domain-containing protein n=1 Tax=Methanoliparum thermophilum TaxID=2491083 RepID=A0A520KT18_METT2|nr:ATP-binding cassette domain-containing protein [Candidatus Methanoliparum sp. LAM-1]RZN64890.1 MAG: ATP-binding cassette domain-containing protein [Candidatus Methanoliparum thermophilum]BDC36237.1 cobalt ABC transporter ATP-binding protein [Candidatus Methanoliparum sp. LAM-1]